METMLLNMNYKGMSSAKSRFFLLPLHFVRRWVALAVKY